MSEFTAVVKIRFKVISQLFQIFVSKPAVPVSDSKNVAHQEICPEVLNHQTTVIKLFSFSVILPRF